MYLSVLAQPPTTAISSAPRRTPRAYVIGLLLLAWILSSSLGCQGQPFEVAARAHSAPDGAGVPAADIVTDEHWEIVPFVLQNATGARDGARTTARVVAVFGADTLYIDLEIEADPQASLRSSTWRMTGPKPQPQPQPKPQPVLGESFGGTVEPTALRFIGGQAGPPSLGGLFVLRDGRGMPRWRVRIASLELPPPGVRRPG